MDNIDLKNKKVMVTGAASMIGIATRKILKQRGAIVCPTFHQTYDPLNDENEETYDLLLDSHVEKAFERYRPDYVFHLAGYNGNIQFNSKYGADIFYKTTKMGINVLNACQRFGVKKCVSALTSCAYTPSDKPLCEEDFLIGIPHPSVLSHGLAKRNIFFYGQLLNKQFNNDVFYGAIFNTAYGPWDNFDPEKTKVVGSLISKFLTAIKEQKDSVELFGTGEPFREAIYCDDAAELLIQTMEKYIEPDFPLNLGFEQEIKIKDLAEKIKILTEYKGKIIWNSNYPDGQYRKILDCSRMKEYEIYVKQTSLDEGLSKTIEWLKK